MISHEATQIPTTFAQFLCFETITMVPIQRKMIDVDLLNAEEIEWVNRYHQQVREKLTPLLKNTDAFPYLLRETEPLMY